MRRCIRRFGFMEVSWLMFGDDYEDKEGALKQLSVMGAHGCLTAEGCDLPAVRRRCRPHADRNLRRQALSHLSRPHV